MLLATAGGESFQINPATFDRIKDADLSFLNDPGLNSFTEEVLLISDDFLSSSSPNFNQAFQTLDVNDVDGTLLDNGVTLTEDFGDISTISFSSSSDEVVDFAEASKSI